MSVTFTKLFSSITESTVWCEPDSTRIVWIAMLAMADKKGRVWASIPGLANRARVPVEAARMAVETFLKPDPDSRTSDFEGRRIEAIDGGWKLLNHGKYRAIRDEEERRAYKAEKERQYRAMRGQKRGQNGQSCTSVDSDGHNAEAEADTEALKTKTTARGTRLDPNFAPSQDHRDLASQRGLSLEDELAGFRDYFIAAPGQKGVKLDWSATFRNWLRNSRNGGKSGAFTGKTESSLGAAEAAIRTIRARTHSQVPSEARRPQTSPPRPGGLLGAG